MLKLIEYLVKILFQYLPIIVLTIVLLTIGYGLLLRVLRLKINNPFLQWLINLLGLHFLDTSQISLEFHSYLKLVCNYSKKIILNIEPDELSHHLVGNQYPGGGYQKVIWSVLGDTIFLTFNRSLFFSDDWFKLAKLLLCYRKAQPINGLILGTTVADSLEGSKVSTRLSLFDRCTQYPVYFVLVDGKKLGELTLPTESMMGWSCDKPPEKALYSPTEISQLLNTVKVHIISVFEQLNLHTTTVTSLAVSKSIADWTDKQLTLFNSLFYNDLPLFLRGVYVMDLETQTGEQLVALVCQENLATPSNQPRTKYANIIYNLFLALGLVLYLTLPLFYKQLLHEAGNLTVLWNNLISMNSKPNMTLENNIMDLARHLKTLNDNDLSFGTIPASWGSNLYSKIRSKLVEVYNFTLIHRIINTFNQNLTQTLLDTYPYKLPAFTCTSPIDTIELHQLYYFIKHLEELKNFQNLILNLIGSDNLTAFNDCVWHVTGQELPKEFFKNVNLYVKAKQKNLPTVKKIEDSLSILEQLLEKKVNNFFDSIGGTGIQKIVTDLTDNLLFLQKNPTYYSIPELSRLKQNLVKLKSVVMENKLLNQDDFTITGQYSDLFTCIEHNLGQMMSTKFKNKMNTSFVSIKNELISFKLPIYGPVLVVDPSGTQFNPGLDDLISFLQEIDQLQLMQKVEKVSLLKTGNCIWNQATLTSVMNNLSTIKSFIDGKGSLVPVNLRLFLMQVISKISAEKIFAEVANSGREEVSHLQEQIANFATNLPTLLNIINAFTNMQEYDKSLELTILINNQYSRILSDLYAALEQAGIFSINAISILNPATTDKIINEFIQSNRANLESYYLTIKSLMSQMEKIYRANIKEPSICSSWKRIVDYFTPNTDVSLEVLEHYIQQVLKAQDLSELSQVTKPAITGNDFVVNKINEIEQVVIGKINLMLNQEIAEVYSKTKEMFDTNLRNYFPFAPLNAPDIPKRQFLLFYDFWLAQRERIRNVLKLCKNQADFNSKSWYQFLSDFISFMPWIESIQNNTPFLIKIRDRTNPEKNAQHLTLWKLVGEFDPFQHYFQNQGLDASTAEFQMNQSPKNYYTYTKIDMAYKLADTSPFIFMTGNPKIAGMSEDGSFSLLRLINLYYSHQDQDTIYLKIRCSIKNADSGVEDELIGWISVKSSLAYSEAPRNAPELISN